MGTSERRERQRQDLRRQILDAARELFTEFGYEAVTMRRVAEKIEYAPATIYLHFRDKEALVSELCTVDFLGLAARFRALEAERDPVRRLRAIGAVFLRFAREKPHHYRMMFMTPTPPVAVTARGIEKGNVEVDAWAFLNRAIEDARKAGLIRPDLGGPEAVAHLFFAALHGIVALHVAKANDPWVKWQPVEALADRMIDVLLRGCAPAGPVSAPAPRPTPRRPRPRPTPPTKRSRKK